MIEILCNVSIITCLQDVLKADFVTSIKDIIVYLLCAVASRLISQRVEKYVKKNKTEKINDI